MIVCDSPKQAAESIWGACNDVAMTDDHFDGVQGGELADDVEAFRLALADDGLSVPVHDQLEALVASAAGEAAFWALVGAGSTGFLTEFGKLQAQNLDTAVKRLLRWLVQRRRVIVSEQVGDKTVEVVITPELPEAAYRQLEAGQLAAPSGRLVWDPATSSWRDSLDIQGH